MSWRANPPVTGEGRTRRVVPFDEFWRGLTRPAVKEEAPEITDEEIEAAMKAGRMKFLPPGTNMKEA